MFHTYQWFVNDPNQINFENSYLVFNGEKVVCSTLALTLIFCEYCYHCDCIKPCVNQALLR